MPAGDVARKTNFQVNYYNEHNPQAAAWLRELIRQNKIAPGVVDERDIQEVRERELRRFTQCHFFAGIGGWSYALRLAGVPDNFPVWTGSCPCQPFSIAGQGKGEDDERHLWPQFRKLITQCAPATVFGEQVASAAGRIWLSGVRTDLEALAYAVGAADLCAAGISAPHIRQRLFWLADSDRSRRAWSCLPIRSPRQVEAASIAFGNDAPPRLANPKTFGRQQRIANHQRRNARISPPVQRMGFDHANPNAWLADSDGCHGYWGSGPLQVGWNAIAGTVKRGGRKFRAQWRVKPGLSLLADGIPGRVAQVCGFGNAIVPELAAEFIQAYRETLT